jgi:hypothetical protein
MAYVSSGTVLWYSALSPDPKPVNKKSPQDFKFCGDFLLGLPLVQVDVENLYVKQDNNVIVLYRLPITQFTFYLLSNNYMQRAWQPN